MKMIVIAAFIIALLANMNSDKKHSNYKTHANTPNHSFTKTVFAFDSLFSVMIWIGLILAGLILFGVLPTNPGLLLIGK